MDGSAARGHRISASALAILLAVIVAGCGGDDGDDGDDAAREEVSDVVTEIATSDDPEVCTELVTEDYVEQLTQSEGSTAVAACALLVESTAAHSVEVSVGDLDTDGGEAEADVTGEGGGFDGMRLTVELVEEEGQWKADRIAEAELLDREAYLESQEEILQDPPLSMTDEQADCIVDAIDLTDEEIEAAVVEADPTAYTDAYEACGFPIAPPGTVPEPGGETPGLEPPPSEVPEPSV